MKKIIIIFLLFFNVSITNAVANHFVIDAGKNATSHNNLGLLKLEEGYYDMAIAEFQLAIELAPESKACATYYNNLGTTYMKVGLYKEAQIAFENSIKISPLTFLYYQNVVQSYKMQGLLDEKIEQYKKLEDSNSLYMIMLGLCYIEKGEIKRGIIKLDEFCMREPYLLTTNGVKQYLKKITKDFY